MHDLGCPCTTIRPCRLCAGASMMLLALRAWFGADGSVESLRAFDNLARRAIHLASPEEVVLPSPLLPTQDPLMGL